MPRTFTAPSAATRAVAKRLAEALRFFHWELEFPDVFDAPGAGFDALLGNPPWDIAKPVSKEFFSNIDPLYRSYGKQEALRKQTEYFQNEQGAEAGRRRRTGWTTTPDSAPNPTSPATPRARSATRPRTPPAKAASP